MSDNERNTWDLTAELAARQDNPRKGSVVVVKLREGSGWAKLQLTTGRLKGHKGCWYNYKNLTPEAGGDLEGSVNLLKEGRWYIHTSSDDDKVIEPLISLSSDLEEAHLDVEKDTLDLQTASIDDADPLGVDELINEIKELCNEDLEVSTPVLNEETYQQYCRLEHTRVPANLFLNEAFEFRIMRDEDTMRELFSPTLAALRGARRLFSQIKEQFVSLHQAKAPNLSRIFQALKLCQVCIKKIKTKFEILNQKIIDSKYIPEPARVRFESDVYDQCRMLDVYNEVCMRLSSRPSRPDDHSVSIQTPSRKHRKSTNHEHHIGSVSGLFNEVDRAAQLADDMTKRSRKRQKAMDRPVLNSTSRLYQSSIRESSGQDEAGSNDSQSSISSSSSDSESDDSDTESQYREPSRREAARIPTTEADLKTISRLEQSLTEMKERTMKVMTDNVKNKTDIGDMDESDLLSMSKYGASAWATAIEKLDSSRYTTSGCLNSLKGKLSLRKVEKIKNSLRDAKHASKRASDSMRWLREEVTRRNISTVPVSQEVSKCALIVKFSGTSIPHVYTWAKDIELAIRQLKIPLTLQGNFIKKHLEGEAMSRVDLEIPRSKTNPSKEDVLKVLKKYYGRPFIIMKQLADKHIKIRPIPDKGHGRSSDLTAVSKACMEHLKVIVAAEELAAEVGNNLTTIYDEHYLRTLKCILPLELLKYVPALGSPDQEIRFKTIKQNITQLEQTSSLCAIEHSLEKPTNDPSPPKVMLIDTPDKGSPNNEKLCYLCQSPEHLAASCPRAQRQRGPPFAPGTRSAITTCRICKAAADLKGKEATPAPHSLSKNGWTENDTCPSIVNLNVTKKAELLDKLRICKSCLRSYTHTSFHPGPTCDLRNLNVLRCTSEGCPLRVTTCTDHLSQNREKLDHVKSYYSTKDQSICFLSSCDSWRQEIISLRSDLKIDLKYMREGAVTMSQSSILLTMSNPDLPYLCSDPTELPKLTNKVVHGEKEGTPTFLVFKLQGEDGTPLSVMFDTGASFSLFRTDVMGKSLIASRVQDDRPDIVAGIGGLRQVENWKCLLPLAKDNSYQVVSAQSVDSIISVRAVDLNPSLTYIKKVHSPDLDFIEVQQLEDTEIAGLIGVKSSALQPKLITMTSLGVGLYEICLKAAKGEPQYALGGNIPTLTEIYQELGKGFIDNAFQEVSEGLNGFYDMKNNLLVSSEEIRYQEEARSHLLGIQSCNDGTATESQNYNDVTTVPIMTLPIEEPHSKLKTRHVCGPKCIKGHRFDEEHATHIPGSVQDSQVMLIDSPTSQLNELQGEVYGSISKQMLRELIGINFAAEDNYRCIDCLGCKSCKISMKVEMNSAKAEEEAARLRECVRIDNDLNRIICKLPLKEDDKSLLAPNYETARKRLHIELLKLKRLPDKEQLQVRDSFLKLRKLGYIKTLSELKESERAIVTTSKVNYFIPVSIAYKESSVSTPARITLDASSKTSSTYSLNNLLPVGSNSFNIAKLVQAWRIGQIGFFSDISKFYNSFALEPEFWPLQQMLWEENLNPNTPPTSYYIVTLIYGVSCVAGLTEIGLEKLEGMYPEVLNPILQYRYIDDLARSFGSLPEALRVTGDALEKLKSYGLRSKGSVFTGIEPPEEMRSPDGTVLVAGHAWDTATDEFRLRIPQIILGKKSKAKGKTTFLKVFKGNSLQELNEFIPAELTLRMMLSLTASIWDVSGQMSPLIGMLWHCVRRACLKGRNYDRSTDKDLRDDFITGLWEVQLLKNYRYPRTQITNSATAKDGTLFCFSDAGLNFEQSICYASFKEDKGSWTCQFMQSKNVLVHVDRSIPNAELNAAATTSKIALAVLKNNPGVFTRSILCVDSTTVLFWSSDLTSRFNVFRRARTQAIREAFNSLYYVRTALNPADTGTRTTVRAEDISPSSRFFRGPEYITLGEEKCVKEGILTPAEEVVTKQGVSETTKAGPSDLNIDFIGVVTRSQQARNMSTPSAPGSIPNKDMTSTRVNREPDLGKEVLLSLVGEDYLICPLHHGLVMSVKGTALVLKFIVSLGSRILGRGNHSPTLALKLRSIEQKITSMARSNTFPAVFVSQAPPYDAAKSYPYSYHTLNTDQVILTYPGVTRARKGLEHTKALLTNLSTSWCRPLSQHQHQHLVKAADELCNAIKLLKGLHNSQRAGILGSRGTLTMAFLSKLIRDSTTGIKLLGTYHEMAEIIALMDSKDVREALKVKQAQGIITKASIISPSFISLMGTQDSAVTFSEAATYFMVRVAQSKIRSEWTESKQARYGSWENGLLISHHRWRDATAALSDLESGGLDMSFLTGFQINTSAPVLPRSSALYLSLACHIHVNVSGVRIINSTRSFTHRSARMDYLISLHFAFSPGGSLVFQRIKDTCMDCHKKNKKAMNVKFGPLTHKILNLATPFSISAVDLVGPILVKQMPHSRATRGKSGLTKAYIVVFVCRITHLTWGEVCESRKTPDVCSAFSRFASIWGTPRHVTTDSEGSLQKVLREASFLSSVEDRLFKQLGIKVTTVPVSHHQRNPAEPRCRSMQHLIKGVNLERHGVTIFGLQDITYLAATLTNSIPFGVSLRNACGSSPKVFSPLSFLQRGMNRERRTLMGPILVPSSLTTYFASIDHHYKQMLHLYHTVIIPSMMTPAVFTKQNKEADKLAIDDIVYFKKRPQATMSDTWCLGRVIEVEDSSDGEVRVVKLVYYGIGISDESQESISDLDPEEDLQAPLTIQKGALTREHHTTRDAREVVKLPTIDTDLQDHFTSLSQSYTENHESNAAMTASSISGMRITHQTDFPSLVNNACLLQSGLRYLEHHDM